MTESKGKAVDANTQFGFNILHAVERKGQNTFVSPLSISLCVAMSGQPQLCVSEFYSIFPVFALFAANGAQNETRKQILKTLCLPDDITAVNKSMLQLTTCKQKNTQFIGFYCVLLCF